MSAQIHKREDALIGMLLLLAELRVSNEYFTFAANYNFIETYAKKHAKR